MAFHIHIYIYTENQKLDSTITPTHQGRIITTQIPTELFKVCYEFYKQSGFQSALNELYVIAHNHIYPEDNFFAVQRAHCYRSRQLSAARFEHYIRLFDIKTIINLRGVESRPKWWQDEVNICRKYNVHHYNIPMDSRFMTPKKQLLELLYLYDNAPRPILIHCKSGADRTGEAAAIWVMDQMQLSKEEASHQLSIEFGHSAGRFPAKDFLIKIWRGRKWLMEEYNPAQYTQFTRLTCNKVIDQTNDK